MKTYIFSILTLLFGLILPYSAGATVDTGTATVNFSSTQQFDERATSVFLDTRNKEAVLPLRYTARNLGLGLKTEFKNNQITALTTDGTSILAGNSKGALALVNAQGSAEILTSRVPKAKKINGLGFMSELGLWIIGGEANSGSGAMLYTLKGDKAEDFQAQAKEINLDRVDEVACSSKMCLIYGVKGFSTKQVVRFDGTSLTNITETFSFSASTPWQVAASGDTLMVAGVYKDTTAGITEPYIVRIYRWRNGAWQQISSDSALRGIMETQIDLNWNGQEWILAQKGSSKQPARIWAFNDTGFSEITPRFSQVREKLLFNPIVSGVGELYYIGGESKLYTSFGNGLDLTTGYIKELKGIEPYALLVLNGKMLVAGRLASLPALYEITVEGVISSATIQTNKIASAASNQYFKKATLQVIAETPTSLTAPPLTPPQGGGETRIEYALSPDGGVHFENVTAGQPHTFTNAGRDLRFRTVLMNTAGIVTPRLKTVTISFEKALIENATNLRKRDDTRRSDLVKVARALETFKKDKGVYPTVDAREPEVRFKMLKQYLVDGAVKYLTAMPVDPKYLEDLNFVYDYIMGKAGTAYLLRARFEEPESKRLAQDIDGQPLEAGKYDYTCDDPWYCEGKGFEIPLSAPPLTPPQRGGETAQSPLLPEEGMGVVGADSALAGLVSSDDGKVWRIASIGSGDFIEQRKLYIPSASVITKLKGFYGKMKQVGRAQLDQIPTARLVKTEDQADVYYITETFLKRALLNWNVFTSYGNKARDIVIVKKEELAAYGNSTLIRLAGDVKVWLIENGIRHYIPSPTIMQKRGLKWENVAPVNSTELNSYKEGEPLE